MLLLDEDDCDVLRGSHAKARRLESGRHVPHGLSSPPSSPRSSADKGNAPPSQASLPTSELHTSSTPSISFRTRGGDGLAKMDLLRYDITRCSPLSRRENEEDTALPISLPHASTCRTAFEHVEAPAPSSSPVPLPRSSSSSSFLSLTPLSQPYTCASPSPNSSGYSRISETPDTVPKRTHLVKLSSGNDFSPLAMSPSREEEEERSFRSVSERKITSGSEVQESPCTPSPRGQKPLRTIVRIPSQRTSSTTPLTTTTGTATKQSKLSDFFFSK